MPWITTEEAAEILDYHTNYIRKLLRSGRLKGKKFGIIWLIDPDSVFELRDLLAAQDAEGYSKNDPRRGRK
jgi:excisionase family DNA binding protein